MGRGLPGGQAVGRMEGHWPWKGRCGKEEVDQEEEEEGLAVGTDPGGQGPSADLGPPAIVCLALLLIRDFQRGWGK